jgi:hypothetical protein
MHKLIVLPFVICLAAAAPASSEPPAVANQIAPSDSQRAVALSGGKAGAAVQEKKICKQLERTGSRLPRRACLTEREWKQLEAELDQ